MSGNFKKLGLLILACLALILISGLAIINNLGANISLKLNQLIGLEASDSLINFFKAPFVINDLITENAELRQANVNLQFQLASLRNSQIIQKENLVNYIQANALNWDKNVPGVLIVDKGVKDGVVAAARVIDLNNQALGLILDSYNNYSRIATLYYPNLSFNVMNQDGKILGSAITQGQGVIEVDFVSKDIALSPGEVVFTAGQDGVFTPGLVAGRVIKITSGISFNQIILEPAFKKSDLIKVFIKK